MTRWRAVGRLRSGDPSHIAGFEVVGRLGEGGMGVVYLGRHPVLGQAAVKFVHRHATADPSFRDRFRREIEVAEHIRSPRVAPVLAADPDAERPWLATAFVDGPTLQEAVDDDGPMEGDRLIALAVALADALASIHRGGVVHRDLKPANILLTAETPVVIDFGIAAMRDAPALTQTGMTLGTPGWMAPEQVRGHECGPLTDVFAWSLVMGYAASGHSPFGSGPADALFYRIVHEEPDLPEMPEPLGMLVRAGLAKEPEARPDVAQLLATLTEQPLDATVVDAAALGATALEATAVGATAMAETVADRTAIVPTIVALGWGVDALPTRPDGRPRAMPPAPPPAREVVPGSGASFWYAGREHHDARSLAVAFQGWWDDAVEQIFRRRDPIWLGELRGFLQTRGLHEADHIVSDSSGTAPAAASMARLLLALDPNIDPRVGKLWLTPDGLDAAARAVVDGRDDDGDGERLAEVGAARLLRLWRGLPDMERAAAIDERWHHATEALERFMAGVSGQAGWPSQASRHRAIATLLLCALHPDHERHLERQLAAARQTDASRQPWWAGLAAQGNRNPAAAVLAVMTADRARDLSRREAQAARTDERQWHDPQGVAAEPHHHRAATPAPARAPAVPAASAWRFLPLPRAQSAVGRAWALVVMFGVLALHLWMVGSIADPVVAHHVAGRGGANAADLLRSIRDVSGLVVVLLVAMPAMYVATRALFRHGASRAVVRLYAVAAAALDLLLGLVLFPVAAMGALVATAGVDGAVVPDAAESLGDGLWWAAGALVLFGFVGAWLVIRSLWRLGRALFGGTVAGSPMPARAAQNPGVF